MTETRSNDAEKTEAAGWLLQLHGGAQSVLLAGSIILLALTGLPQKFDSLGFSQWIMDAVGGIETLRLVHRVAGGVMFFSAVYHVVLALVAVLMFRAVGPLPMTPDFADIRDAWQMVRFFFGLRQDRVTFERPSYIEKIDYLVIAWSVTVMGLSGVVFLFPVRVSHMLSGDAVLAALEVHSDGAILVLAWVVLVHLVYARLAPTLFPSRASVLGFHIRSVGAGQRHGPSLVPRRDGDTTEDGATNKPTCGPPRFNPEDHQEKEAALPNRSEPGK